MSTRSHGRHSHHPRNAHLSEPATEHCAPAAQAVSAADRFREIQTRAYGLWEEAGWPGGDAARERCWCEAEKESQASCAEAAWDA
jgi:hypothetical protein